MKAVIQRVARAAVRVDGRKVGEVGPGLLALLGVADGDGEEEAVLLARKTANLRIFSDQRDKMNRSVLETGGGVLVVSNFTLCADTKKGNRPSFDPACEPGQAEELYRFYSQRLREEGVANVANGVFGADMAVELLNDGPVTILLDTDVWKKER
ncbi:MAG: D-tyrosyl-tRNA(Tyr) deacylase [Clostridiales bacterium]|nr:D-tyrosyl-tRNA(Tyr) deacylase [Clostridiales bacterium]